MISPRIRKLLSDHDYKTIVDTLSIIPEYSIKDEVAEILAMSLRKTDCEEKALLFLQRILQGDIRKFPKSVRITSRILSLQKRFDEAYNLLNKALKANPAQYWYYLSMGDIYYYHAVDLEKALKLYLKGLEIGKQHLRRDILSIYRYLLKRISHCLFELNRFSEAISYFEEFKKLEPSNFYESDFVLLGKCYGKSNQLDKALEILQEGTRRRKGWKCLKEIENLNPEFAKTIKLKPPLLAKSGALKIPVKTKIITEEDDAPEVIKRSIQEIAKPGDIITFASAVAAITDGRIYSAESIKPTFMARILASFVTASSKNSFATTSPLANPLSFQVAINITSLPKILWATFCGAIGKVFKRKGWFYMVAGPEVAMIDDMPASMAPYDYFVIPGPYNSDKLSQMIKDATGFETAIIDANDLGIAWVVGATSGVNRNELEQYMSDNPAGNEDDQTPIIIVRKDT